MNVITCPTYAVLCTPCIARNLGQTPSTEQLSFFREILGATTEDIRTAVVACPSLLGYSLDRRIRPRVDTMLECSLVPRFAEHKWLLTAMADDTFNGWVTLHGGQK